MNVYKVKNDNSINREILEFYLDTCFNMKDMVRDIYGVYGETNRRRLIMAIDYYSLKKEFEEFKLRTQGHRRADYIESEILIDNSEVGRPTLKKYILNNNLLEYKCQHCGIGNEYNGKKLTLQLDHIDGKNNNNQLDNLRFLCPNCHSQTDTFGTGNKNLGGRSKKLCSICKKQEIKLGEVDRCRSCFEKTRGANKIKLFSKEDFQKLFENYTMREMAAVLVCSWDKLDKLREHFCISKPSKGYWISKRCYEGPDYTLFKEILDKYEIKGRFDWTSTQVAEERKQRIKVFSTPRYYES